jgi:hypothetical protein
VIVGNRFVPASTEYQPSLYGNNRDGKRSENAIEEGGTCRRVIVFWLLRRMRELLASTVLFRSREKIMDRRNVLVAREMDGPSHREKNTL